uniref:Letm1 RBD domain-containing protein n=1 Tax=Amphora coffeiformis TaxID=265554 RepID=A0A7S3KWU1_9STRA|mmetsp:Transcript_19549/g.39677  ORF Transcript_19549/g.39677 Transcript_19549/m.39677 type:complete len:644 (+) Transcript_19549:126-2057(+)
MKTNPLCAALLVAAASINIARAYLLPRSTRHVRVSSRFQRLAFQHPVARVSSSTLMFFSAKTNKEAPTGASESSCSAMDVNNKTNKQKLQNPTRLRRLKDLVWIRETLEDLTAAEFACSVEAHQGEEDETVQKRRKRAVDYEKLLSQLNRRIKDLGCNFNDQSVQAKKNDEDIEPFTCVLQSDVGMAITAYSEDQRQLLLERLVTTRQNLMEIVRGYKLDNAAEDLPFSIQLPDLRVDIPRETNAENSTSAGPKLYVRDDGTVDWDGALQDQAALRMFGSAVWARINGRDPDLLGDGKNSSPAAAGHSTPASVTARVIETPEIKHVRAQLNALTMELNEMQAEHTALLNSVISAGQAIANVNLASLAPAERSKIMESADSLEKMRERVSFQTLLYELERIYTYLAGELGNPQSTGYISLQDRLNVAEFGLLESQVESFSKQLHAGDSVDADVLAVVMEQLNDFKRRLGIDYFVTGVTFDREAIFRWLAELVDQTKKGLAFYVKGVRLLWNDVAFCLNLVSRAAQGYTLKPREVRTIRRTFKDILTFIPFVIILIIPLTPVGHVLVFGAIQRFFPEFFPTCFTEQRQNLLQLYENAEYTEFTINETWREKLSRLVVAFFYMVANASKALYARTLALLKNEGSSQ